MQIGVTGIGCWTAAGGLHELAACIASGDRAFTEHPPYDATGLSTPWTGQIADLDRNRPAEALLRRVVRHALAEAGPTSGRTGFIVGTSSGNISGPWERWHRGVLAGEPTSEEGTGRDGPTQVIAREQGFDGPIATLSVACVSGTAVLAVAEGWLRDAQCERVVVAGVDALSLFVHAGFSGLGALSGSFPTPFTDTRDGLLLGEGAAALVLEPSGGVQLAGVGLSADAVHMTAPDRQAGGAIRALRQALERADIPSGDIDRVSVHGTGTRFNDSMERVALKAVFPHPPSIQLVKRSIGHTMGAAGAIEAALAVHTVRQTGRAVPSMSSAFGGMNATAVFAATPGPPREPESTTVHAPQHSDADLNRVWPDAPLAAKRVGGTVRAGVSLVREVLNNYELPANTALVLTTRTGCRPTDLTYHERLVAEGAARASRRQFTYTVPAAPICEASLIHGLTGPLLTFLGTGESGGREAERLVRWGLAPAAIALDVEAGDASHRVQVVQNGYRAPWKTRAL